MNPELADLAAYAIFDVDPNVRSANKPLHFFMVSVALFDALDGLTPDELHDAVCAQMIVDHHLSADEVDAAVKLGVGPGLILLGDDGKLRLSAVRRAQLEQARTRIGEQREAFHGHMAKAVAEAGVSPVDEGALRDHLEHGLQSLFGEQSAVIAAAYGPDGIGLDSALSGVNARDRLREIGSALAPGGAGPNKLQRELIHTGLEKGLLTLPKMATAYLASLYHRTVAAALLAQDPTIRKVKHQLAGRRVAYLDANVLMAWMFEADPLHEVAEQAIELTKVVGATLRVTTHALDELAVQIREADRFMTQYKGERRLLSYADDVVVRSFRMAQREHTGLVWSAFVAAFAPPDTWITHHGVEVDADGTEALEADERLQKFEAAVRRRRPQAATVVIRTDACNMLHVLKARDGIPADSMGNRAWLVTNDGSLELVERDMAAAGDLAGPVSRSSRVWCDLLGPCVPPDAERLAGYVTRLVQSEFGLLAEDPTFVNKAFLNVLSQSRFKIADVLEDDRIAGQVLARLQADDELRRLIGDAEPDSEEWNEELAAAVQRTLAELAVATVDEAELNAALVAQAKAEQAAEAERKSRIDAVRENADLKRVVREATDRAERAEEELAAKASRRFLARLFGR